MGCAGCVPRTIAPVPFISQLPVSICRSSCCSASASVAVLRWTALPSAALQSRSCVVLRCRGPHLGKETCRFVNDSFCLEDACWLKGGHERAKSTRSSASFPPTVLFLQVCQKLWRTLFYCTAVLCLGRSIYQEGVASRMGYGVAQGRSRWAQDQLWCEGGQVSRRHSSQMASF